MINRIQKIARIGIFKDFSWNPASLEDFKKYNALYGWNGSGKTTLSRLFSMMETGDDTEVDLAPDSSCVFATSTGNAVISTSETPAPNNNIKVFNEDFIRNNLEWVSSKATPILIIGKEKIDQKESLAEARRLKERCSTALGHINSNLGSLEKERDKILDRCRKSVVEELSTVTDIKPRGGRATSYRTYTAIDVTNLLTAEGASFPALTDEEKINRRIALSEKDSKDKLDDYVANLGGLDRAVELVNDLASKTLSSMVESTLNDEIQENDELREWLRVGHKLHPAEVGIVTCKFCKNEVSQSRLENIDAFFDQAQLSLIENVDQVLQIISGISIPLPANHEKVYKQFQAGYVKAREAFFVEKLNFDTKIKEAVLKLKNKKKRPFEKLQIDTTDLIASKTALEATFSALNAQISQHNDTTDQFGKNRANAAHDLELHLIGQHSSDFNEKVSAIATVQKRKAANDEELKRQTDLEKSLQHSMNDHSIAADEFNKMLKEFLGRSEIALKAESDGYIIERNGKPGKNLSEGERNAIAVIFFLTKLKEDGFDAPKGIIVIDDPVSSFDSQHTYQAFSFIKSKVKDINPSQLFILTHNFHFFRQLRNWYKHEGAAGYYCIKSKSLPSMERFSVLETLDPLLRSHNSEYTYLFKLVYDRANAVEDPSLSQDYIFPNVIRKLLENYISMKVPIGGIDIHGKLTKLLEGYTDDDVPLSSKSRIESYCQDNSHPLYQDSPVDFDERLMGELKSACKDVMRLIELTDKKHYEHLESQLANSSFI